MSIIGTLPNNIQNGQSVDATPLMADFNFIVNQVNSNANPIGTFTAPSGTRMVFHQAAAPSGWVQDTTITDHTIQVIGTAGGGTGGANAYSGMFLNQWTSDGHALSIAELAVHGHVDAGHGHVDAGHTHPQASGTYYAVGAPNVSGGVAISLNVAGGNTQGGVANIQTGFANISNTGSGTAHTHTKTFNVNYVAMIMAAKT